jgi:hypothetical protein
MAFENEHKPSRKVQELLDSKVNLSPSPKRMPASYPNLHEKVALELAIELERENNINYVVVSWESQEKAQTFFNEKGFVETLTYMLDLREKNDKKGSGKLL